MTSLSTRLVGRLAMSSAVRRYGDSALVTLTRGETADTLTVSESDASSRSKSMTMVLSAAS
jgi:hypothetical protein